MYYKRVKSTAGFTLIEMIVSLGLFTVVITIAVGALLVLINTNLQLQSEQSVMTNLSFALDSMTRELRTGTHYYCRSEPTRNSGPNYKIFQDGVNIDSIDSPPIPTTRDCAQGRPTSGNTGAIHGVAFIEGGDSITGAGNNRVLYFYDAYEQKLFRKVADQVPQAITSDEIVIQEANFFVTGSTPQNEVGSSDDQPAVTIVLTASAASDTSARPYIVQTTVTQRAIDI